MNTYLILEDNMERLQKKLTRIRTKCNKYGCDFVYREVSEEFKEVKNEDGSKQTCRFIVVECEGTAKINGWRFIATLEHHDNGNIVRKLIDEVPVPEQYFNCEPTCDHCHSIRHRKDTYLIYNQDTNEYKQVGSSCLCDFTHGFDAEAAAAYIALFDELIKGEAPYEGGYSAPYFRTVDVLKHAADIVDHIGYRSSSWDGPRNEMNTRVQTHTSLKYDINPHSLMPAYKEAIETYRTRFNPDYNDPELISYVEDAMKWVKDSEDNSDYMHNLKVIVDSEYIQAKNFGYAVSIIPTYNKYIEKKTEADRRAEAHEAEAKISNYIGEVGQRVTLTGDCEISIITSWETDYGITIRYKIVDTNGNVIMWDSSSGIRDNDREEVVSITGTIKKLDEYNGVKQTWLTRCRVKYAEKPKNSEGHETGTKDVDEALDTFFDAVNS